MRIAYKVNLRKKISTKIFFLRYEKENYVKDKYKKFEKKNKEIKNNLQSL